MNSRQYDAIVIGSGAGGAATAYRLVRSGWRVALLEKGPRLPRDGSTLDVERVIGQGEFLSREQWVTGDGAVFTPEEHFNLGGKTKWYGAALLRYSPQEFLPDVAHGCLGWPLPYESFERYYAEAESLLGVRQFEPEPDLRRITARLTRGNSRWSSLPLPLALAPGIVHDAMEARHFDGFASVRALKNEAEQSLLARIIGDPRLTVLTNTEATSLVAEPTDAQRVVGVRTADGHELRARHVILAAGALHSPRLLQRHLRHHDLERRLPVSRHVGAHLKMHLLTALVAISHRRQSDLLRKTQVLLHSEHPHSSAQPLGFDAELIARLVPAWVPRSVARFASNRAYGFFLQTEDGSDSRNRVDDQGPNEPPVMDYRPDRLPKAEMEHRRFTHALQRALLGAGFVSATQRIGLAGTAHVCGTMTAGTDASYSVVDRAGAVHGLEGLYVADGSVLPRSSRVNPSLTIYAWGLHVADQLLRRSPQENTTCEVLVRA